MVDVEKGPSPLEGGVLTPREVQALRNVVLRLAVLSSHCSEVLQEAALMLRILDYLSSWLHGVHSIVRRRVE